MRLLLLICAVCIPSVLSLTTKSAVGVEEQVGRQLVMDIDSKMTCFHEELQPEMHLTLTMMPYPPQRSRFPMKFRLTSPSGDFSDWAEGDGEAKMVHNCTETGSYEICLFAPRPVRVQLYMFFHHPGKVEAAFKEYLEHNNLNNNIQETVAKLFQSFYNIKYSIKFYNQISFRDEEMVEKNGEYIQTYSISFSVIAFLIAITQIVLVRRMFRVDTKKIRI